MSLLQQQGARPVHFPANPDKFGFDAEVSRIFPDMAKRAIPNFYEAHAAHARMLKPYLLARTKPSILDAGASRGAFFAALDNEYGKDVVQESFKLVGIDNSPEMCDYMRNDYPGQEIFQMDLTSEDFFALEEKYDVVCAHYVLQFVPSGLQGKVLQKLMHMVKPGGVFIFGHKAFHHDSVLGTMAHEEYIRFRVENGYTREEIAAKTTALRGSMFPVNHESVMREVKMVFGDVQETFRYMMFTTFMAVK